mmetsp:Transcript_7685/g.21380  ORF Transcript_7685/g.21380 Transcript_7685/m.21380 type:complete len:139 (-) Transcript_7685:4347-4763(-)
MVCATDAPSLLPGELSGLAEGAAGVGHVIDRRRDAQSATFSCGQNHFDDRRVVPLMTLEELSAGLMDAATLARRTGWSIVLRWSFGGPLTLAFASHGHCRHQISLAVAFFFYWFYDEYEHGLYSAAFKEKPRAFLRRQ